MTTREKILALLQQETSVLSGEKLPKNWTYHGLPSGKRLKN